MLGKLAIAVLAGCTAPHPGGGGGADAPATDARADARRGDPNVTVSLTFDDTLADQFQVGAMLAAHGMHGTFYINSPRIGFSPYMTLAQVQSLRELGNEIAGHTLNHLHLAEVDAETARHEICDDRDALVAMGFAAETFAYPFGSSNTAAEQIAHDCGYTSARDIGGLYSADSCTTCPYGNPVPPADLYEVRTVASVAGTSLDTLQRYITDAEAHGGGWIPLVFHHVCDACNPALVRPATLEALLDWLEARGTRVETVQDVTRQ